MTYFEGLPIPTSLMLVGCSRRSPAWTVAGAAAARRRSLAGATLHPLSLLFVLHGSAMISKTLRIPKP